MSKRKNDDAEPVTEEWLLSAGFRLNPNGHWWCGQGRAWTPPSLTVHPANQHHPLMWVYTDWEADSAAVPVPTTRWQARRLCAALGITLTEGA